MELYLFLRGVLAWSASVALFWPANVPLAAMAYRIRNGPNPIGMPQKEYWLRSTGAALVLAGVTLAALVVDYVLAEVLEFPPGPVHLLVLIAYVPAGMWVFGVFFALDDLLQALGVFVIYLYLPIIVLYLMNLVLPLWQPVVDLAGNFLKVPT